MDWLTVLGLAAVGLIVLVFVLRVERRALWVILLLLVLPAGLLVARWAVLSQRWPELFAGLALTAVLGGLWWWGLGGRRLPRANSDSIRVWGQETGPQPRRQDTAALQAEILHLQEEAARMEAEIQRLKDNRPPAP